MGSGSVPHYLLDSPVTFRESRGRSETTRPKGEERSNETDREGSGEDQE